MVEEIWRDIRRVQRGERNTLWQDPTHIYRIRTDDPALPALNGRGPLSAPKDIVMGADGMLVARPRINPVSDMVVGKVAEHRLSVEGVKSIGDGNGMPRIEP